MFSSCSEAAAVKKLVDKKKAKNSDESALEESDDGDEEGREFDYISDSSEEYVRNFVYLLHEKFIERFPTVFVYFVLVFLITRLK